MEILNNNSKIPQKVALILGFFDGVHMGHREVIKTGLNSTSVLVTFSSSPAEYFNKEVNYIFSRNHSYKLMEKFGVDYVYEMNFQNIAKNTAIEYLEFLLKTFNPISISSGFNHTFGLNKTGNATFLQQNQFMGYEYYCTNSYEIEGELVSSTNIKKFLLNGEIEKANRFLGSNFYLESVVEEGLKLGRKLGYPTANMEYPQRIIRIPYGVYKCKIDERPAVLNWGIKPTINGKESLEIHIPGYEGDLYGKNLGVEIISKIRDEKKFNSLEELRIQIEKDVEQCLK